ncbi:MAG: TIGR03960 family B12-binding radical SAM protein [bacterium]
MKKIKLDEILPFVCRPTRYIGQELNAVYKDGWNVEGESRLVTVALAFPDLYEIGMSNLGLKILYGIINKRDDALAERVFSPWTDMEDIMRRETISLFSLESQMPLAAFDIVGFSLQYELSYTNVLNMMDLAGIPLKSRERDESYPLIIAGGPCSFNPEPLADFIDLFVLGDGEEVIQEIIETYKNYKLSKKDKINFLKQLANIDGIYVPSLYEISYNDDGTVKSIVPRFKDIPVRISKRTVDLNKVDYPARPVVPYMQVVHNRLLLEIMRGCPRGCRFCQAGIIYRPKRERGLDSLLKLAKQSIQHTGYEEISLASLSSTDYCGIEKLVIDLQKELATKKVSVSLPSLRPNNFSLELAKAIARVKKSGLTFAPEAGTERLRKAVNKNISEEDIITAIGGAYASGWKLVKLYFMFGLPTETDEDLQGIINLVRKIKGLYKNLNINITLSAFVPKPNTPFEWCRQENLESLRRKKEYLKKNLPATIRWHKMEVSFLEAVFARGDRKLGQVLETAWKKGCKFDEWDEHFRYDLWQEAFKETGVDPYFYTSRERNLSEVLPWDHLDCGVSKDFLVSEYEKALAAKTGDAEGLTKPQEEEKVKSTITNQRPASGDWQPPAVQQLRIKYAKRDNLRFISHLELVTTLIRALRRMEAPLVFSGGFTPHPKISLGPALPVGVSSETEFFDLTLNKRCEPDKFLERLNQEMPAGLQVLEVREIHLNAPSLIGLIDHLEYEIIRVGKKYTPGEIQAKIDAFMNSAEVLIDKQTKKGTKPLDIRPMTGSVKIKEAESGQMNLILSLAMNNGQTVKPEVVIRKIFTLSETETKKLNIKRLNIGIKSGEKLYPGVYDSKFKELSYAERNLY